MIPDSYSIDLGNMLSADRSGMLVSIMTGAHLWMKLGKALLIAIVGAGAQLEPAAGGERRELSIPTQIMAASLGQQFNIFGQLYAQAGLAILHGIVNPGGYPSVVMMRKVRRSSDPGANAKLISGRSGSPRQDPRQPSASSHRCCRRSRRNDGTSAGYDCH
jgi:hypothetical protein